MDRYQCMFKRLRQKQQGAFVPFVTLGDPSVEHSFAIIDALVAAGADALELGIPFSDPLADGPVIQAANLRALTAGTTTADCFTLLATVRQRYPDLPIGLLVYANLVFSNGIDRFYARCAQVGADSVLIADVPLEESAPFRQAALHHQIAPVFVCPPNADKNLLRQLADCSRGYIYLLSRPGVTGTELGAARPVKEIINTLRQSQAVPTLQGFGISQPCQVKEAMNAGADGAISGSAIVKIIAEHHHQPEIMRQMLKAFVGQMKAATCYC